MQYQDAEMWQQGALTPTHEPRTTTPTPTSRHSKSILPETPEMSHNSEPPTQPPNPPKIRIKRRRAILPLQEQSHMLTSSDDSELPTIELSNAISAAPQRMVTPNSYLNHRFLAPFSPSHSSYICPPKTPTHQISTGVEDYNVTDQDWAHKQGEDIERPLSALSMVSDSSTSSRSSSETAPSFGTSCTSPESESSDPFVNDTASKAPLMWSHPLTSPSSQHPRKRQKVHKKVKWTDEMDEHLWGTYMAYLSDPTLTPFKTLPGSVPPLGVCHRVAREARKSWKGARPALQSGSDDRSTYPFTSLNAAIMRETSAPPRFAMESDSPDTIRARPSSQRSRSSNELTRKPVAVWPRSSSSTRRRLKELCKHKPMLPPHYQRLMQTRTPSPFESSSSNPRRRYSRVSSQPGSSDYESTFSTRDLNLTLATSTSRTMQPGGPLSQLASDAQTPRQSDMTSSNHSSVRGAHQKSQSLQYGLGLSGDHPSSTRQLASPFQEASTRDDARFEKAKAPNDTKLRGGCDLAQVRSSIAQLDPPLQIHAPRPMSGSMKRRAEYQLGEEQIADDADARRDFLEDMFRDPLNDGHRRVRSRGFSLGARRQLSQPHRQLSELFTPPSVAEPWGVDGADTARTESANHVVHTNHANEYSVITGHDDSAFDSISIRDHARRLGSPFAPSCSSGFTNTFPRSMLPHGLDGISGWTYQQQHTDEHGDPGDQTPSATKHIQH